MKLSLVLSVPSVLAIGILLAGCGSSTVSNPGGSGNPGSGSGPAPAVSASAMAATGVAPNNMLEVQFSEAMDATTINAKTFTVADSSGNAVSGAVSYDSDFNVASFTPTTALLTSTMYTATIGTGVASSGGVHLAAAYTDKFTTGASGITAPQSISSVSPASNATCANATAPILITFAQQPAITTINATNIAVAGPAGTPIPVTIGINLSSTQVTLTPSSALPTGVITVSVNNVMDLAGLRMAAADSSSFSTACTSGGGGGSTIQFESQLHAESNLDGATTLSGQVTVDVSGNTTIQLKGATASTNYAVQFCETVDAASSNTAPPCMNLATVSTDSNGDGTATMLFPQAGDWAGEFILNDSSGTLWYQTYLSRTLSNQTYLAVLLPETTTNSGIDTTSSPQLPLTSGSVSLSSGALVFTVNGASPGTNYSTIESETNYIDGSGSYQVSTFTTDASGNGSSTTTLSQGSGGDMFAVEANAPAGQQPSAGYVAGFSVPK